MLEHPQAPPTKPRFALRARVSVAVATVNGGLGYSVWLALTLAALPWIALCAADGWPFVRG